MIDIGYYNREGQEIDHDEWLKLWRDKLYRVIAQTEVEGVWVSTVWLGLNHSFSPAGPKLIFETMIFGPDVETAEVGDLKAEAREEKAQYRYSTEAEAKADHMELVEQIREGQEPWNC